MTRGKAAARRVPSGFTLVEVVVVLAILTLATTAVAPSLWRGVDPGATATARTIRDAYGRAREAAVARGANGVVHLHMDRGDYAILVERPLDRGWDTVAVGRVPLGGVRLLGGAGSWVEIRFDARGRGAGDVVTVVGGDERFTIRPRFWGGGTRVSSR